MPERSPLSLIVFDGHFDRVHYALVLASGAVAVERPTTLFFTGRALRALERGDGWHRLDPGDDGQAPADRDRLFARRGVAGFEELLQACAALGARFIACEMGLRVLGLAREDLRDDLPIVVAGVVTLFAEAKDGPILHI